MHLVQFLHPRLTRWTRTSRPGVVEGTVLRVDSLADSIPKPLNEARVRVIGPMQRSATVDSAGRFTLEGLPDGDYVVRVLRIGFPAHRLTAQTLI